MMRRYFAGCFALLVALAVFGLSGCSGGSRGDAPQAPRRPGVRADQFFDVPMPAMWRPVIDEEQIAIAIAGGSVRRLQLSVQAPPAQQDLQPDQAIARHVSGVLPEEGWTRVETTGRPGDLTQHWTKNGETLEVRATREDSLAVLRYRLMQPPVTP